MFTVYNKTYTRKNDASEMNLLVNTKYRSAKQEIMDDLDYQGPILHDALDKLAKINQWLGGNKVTIDGIKKALNVHPKDQPITIVDLGCGGGDMLREISKFGANKGYQFQLIGIDANQHTIDYARSSSKTYNNIEFLALDVFSETFKTLSYDLVISTLFFHHFKNDTLQSFLKSTLEKANLGIVINDLHRHRLAYYLFKLLCITISNKTIIEDGLTSVLRGFKKQELIEISEAVEADYLIKWKWAFRYQWLLKRKAI